MLTLPTSLLARALWLPRSVILGRLECKSAHRIKNCDLSSHHLTNIFGFIIIFSNFNVKTLMLILTTKQPSRYLQEAKEPQIIDRATNETCT